VILARTSRDPFLAPFTGPVRLTESFLVMPRNGAPRLAYLTPMDRREARASGLTLLTPEALDVERWNRDGAQPHQLLANVLSRALFLCGLAPGRLALAGCVEAGRLHGACELLAAEGWSFVPGEPAVVLLRKRKTPPQVEALRRVAAGTVAAFRAAAELLAGAGVRDLGPAGGELWHGGEPFTVARLRRAVRRVLSDHGLEEPEGSIIAPAEEGTVPHTSGTPGRVLRPGESLVVDLFPCDRRGAPFADCTRTFCVGEPPAALAAAHAEVVAALELAVAGARPGVRAWSLQEAVCEHFGRAGYPTPLSDRGTTRGYVHGLGHGVGFELHEEPSFREHAGEEEGVLEAGDVFALEPGLYEPEAGWAVRLEDLCFLGEDALENLTPLPYALDPRAW
jgi:Xaa-Pro aminopeptidase